MKKLVRKLIGEKLPNIILFVLVDFAIVTFTSFFSVWIRFDFGSVPTQYLVNSYRYLTIDFIIVFMVFLMFKLYTSVWKYASVTELVSIVVASTISELLMFMYKVTFNISMPRSTYIIQVFLIIALTCFSRFGYRLLRMLYIKYENRKKSVNALLVGAGDAGKMIIDEIFNNRADFDSRIVCVVDDNKNKIGSHIRGLKVEGSTKDIERLVEKYHIDEIIIAIPSASKEKIDRIVTECHKTDAEIKILPSIFLSMNERTTSPMSQVRPLSYEDFLGRSEIVVDTKEIANNIAHKTILVTGGGGSIGSELCRQIAKCNPRTLIIFDIYENNAYDIQQELLRDYPDLDLHTVIGSVRDYDRLEKVFNEFRPNQVYHAAAHKHVPLMEVSPNEAIKNNCLGTLNTCKLADKYEVEKFVLISTDKAVRPTNIMGASKRICEMIIQSYDKLSEVTDYVAVRFGNVLGSNGSVIPLFLKQIENGGPVTVTDREMRRFFMTIPEAVSLVLQAGCYAEGGEIFVLDMGKPVKIYDLAEKLIRYKGFEPNVDIKIEITGLRPGEKLYEEILMDEEGLKETPNKLIHIGKPIRISSSFLDDLDELIKAAYKNSNDIKDKVADIVPTYTIDRERIGK